MQYRKTNILVGKGKSGPVQLIFYNKSLHAMKQIKKEHLTTQKHVEHLKQEKQVL